MGGDDSTVIPEDMLKLLEDKFGINKDDIVVTSNVIQSKNNHCGAFTSCLLSGLASGVLVVNRDTNKIQIKLGDEDPIDIPNLNEHESYAFGMYIRSNHNQVVKGEDITNTLSIQALINKKFTPNPIVAPLSASAIYTRDVNLECAIL